MLAQCENVHYTFRTSKKKKRPTTRRRRKRRRKEERMETMYPNIGCERQSFLHDLSVSRQFYSQSFSISLKSSLPPRKKEKEKKQWGEKKRKKSFNRGSNLDITYVESGSLLSEENWRTSGRGVRVKKIRRERWCARLKEERTNGGQKRRGRERKRETGRG